MPHVRELAGTNRTNVAVYGVRCVLLIVVIALWKFLTIGGRVSPVLLPDPGAVMGQIAVFIANADFWNEAWVTTFEVLTAFAITTLIGVSIGVFSGHSEYRTELVKPLLIWLQTIPFIMLYPICVLLFGFGSNSKIFYAAADGVAPVALATLSAVATMDKRYRDFAKSVGATNMQAMTQILIPAARPMILSGVRVGAAVVLTAVIAAEILGAVAGLGYQISETGESFDIPGLYAYITLTLAFILVIHLIMSGVEHVFDYRLKQLT